MLRQIINEAHDFVNPLVNENQRCKYKSDAFRQTCSIYSKQKSVARYDQQKRQSQHAQSENFRPKSGTQDPTSCRDQPTLSQQLQKPGQKSTEELLRQTLDRSITMLREKMKIQVDAASG